MTIEQVLNALMNGTCYVTNVSLLCPAIESYNNKLSKQKIHTEVSQNLDESSLLKEFVAWCEHEVVPYIKYEISVFINPYSNPILGRHIIDDGYTITVSKEKMWCDMYDVYTNVVYEDEFNRYHRRPIYVKVACDIKKDKKELKIYNAVGSCFASLFKSNIDKVKCLLLQNCNNPNADRLMPHIESDTNDTSFDTLSPEEQITEIIFREKCAEIEKSLDRKKSNGEHRLHFCYTEGRGCCFNNQDLYRKLKKHFIDQGYKIIAVPTKLSPSDGRVVEWAEEELYWESNSADEKFNKELNSILEKIRRAKEEGKHKIYFATTYGTVPFNDMELYRKLKVYLTQIKGYTIVKTPNAYSPSDGRLLRFAYEEIQF